MTKQSIDIWVDYIEGKISLFLICRRLFFFSKYSGNEKIMAKKYQLNSKELSAVYIYPATGANESYIVLLKFSRFFHLKQRLFCKLFNGQNCMKLSPYYQKIFNLTNAEF